MPSQPFKIEVGKFGISLTDPGVTDACQATVADFNDFTCQITSGALNASPNVSDETVPATWCDPEQTVPIVGATSYEAAMSFLQDPNVVTGLSRTLFEHDAKSAWVFMGLDGDNPPKAVVKVRLVAGAFGGEGRTTLTADVTLPCDGKPIICFGDETQSESIGGSAYATGATAGEPGVWTPAGSMAPASQSDLAAGIPNVVVANPATPWTVGQHVITGDGLHSYWDGAAWVAGDAPVVGAEEAIAGGRRSR